MELRKKYQERLQKAIAQNDFSNAEKLVKALDLINKVNIGETVKWGDEEWELTLRDELKHGFTPHVKERLALSASAIETYRECPLKYRFKWIDKIPESPNQPQLIFGNIIHRVLDSFHGTKEDLTEDKIIKILNKEWKTVEFEYSIRKEEFKEQAIAMLKRYANAVSREKPDVLLTEHEFFFDIDTVRIRGKIDRIDIGTSGKNIIDYKTNKRSSPAKESIQLAIYCLYFEQMEEGPLKGIPESATLYFLRDEQQPAQSHSFTKPELNTTRDKIEEVAQSIRASNFEPIKGYHCDWCDYKDLACPAWES